MTTFPTMSITQAALQSEPLDPYQIGYFQSRFQNKVHDLIIQTFIDEGLTQASVARKLNKRPEVINRLLTAPGNITVDTLTSLLLALGYEPEISARPLRDKLPPTNRIHVLYTETDPLAAQPWMFFDSKTTTPKDAGMTASEAVSGAILLAAGS
jgi:hypothetical protein